MINNLSASNYYNPAFTGTTRVATSAVALHQNDVQNLVKFVNGQPITATPDISIGEHFVSTIPMLAIFGGITGISNLKNNGLSGQALELFKEQKKQGLAKGWNLKETVKNINAEYNLTRANWAKAGQAEVTKKFKDVLKKQVITDTAERGFFGKLVDKIPGYKALRQSGFGQMMSNKGTGAGWMAVIDAALETFTQVIPTFKQVGAEAGFKQIAKSGAKVVAGAAGWVAGDVAGRAAGAAIGTLIAPGIGTAIGSFVGGFIGGILGSAAASKGARALVGKNELEKHAEQQTQIATQQIEADPETKVALAQQALQHANGILAQDPQNAEALQAKASAENILAEIQPAADSAQESTMAQTQSPVMFQNPFSQASVMPGVPVVPGFDGVNYDMNIYNQYVNKACAMSTPFLNAYQKQYQNNPYIASAK